MTKIQLDIGGMTCASCAARIEKQLNRLDGVTATVNFATEKATVEADAAASVEDLVAAVEAAGYTAPAAASTEAATPDEHRPRPTALPRAAARRRRSSPCPSSPCR